METHGKHMVRDTERQSCKAEAPAESLRFVLFGLYVSSRVKEEYNSEKNNSLSLAVVVRPRWHHHMPHYGLKL